MILARCPACQTTFRVRPEQLRARHGEVRCGHCLAAFNALDHLVDELPPESQQAPRPGVPPRPSPRPEITPRPQATSKPEGPPRPEAAPAPEAPPRPEISSRRDVVPPPEIAPWQDVAPGPVSPEPEVGLRPEATPRPEAAPRLQAAVRPEAAPRPEAAVRPEAAPRPEAAAHSEAAPTPEATPRPEPAPWEDVAPQEAVAPRPEVTPRQEIGPGPAARPKDVVFVLEEKAPSAEPQPPQGEPERPDDADAGDAFMFEEIPLAELQPEKEAPGRSAAPEARETMEVPRDRPAPFTAGTAAAEAAPAPSGTPPFAMHEERPKPEVPEHKTSTFESLAERLEFEVPESFLTQPTPPADIGQADHVRFRQRKTEWPEIPRPAAPFPEFVPPSHAEARFRRRDDERTTRAVPGSAGPAGRPASPFDEVPGKPSGKRIPEPPPTPKAPPVSPAAVEEALRQAAAEAKPEPAPPPPAREAPTPRLEDESLEAERLDERYGRLDRAQRRRWPWAVGLGILLGILWVQVAYLFRDEITRTWPQLRPAYLFVCEYLGCTLELSRVAGAVHIETSDLLSDPKVPGSFTLNAVVRNGAPYPQAFPYLELTLTDARDRPVVRRALSPDEWVPAEKLERGFLAGEEIVVHLPFHAPDVEAVGYRIYAFYP